MVSRRKSDPALCKEGLKGTPDCHATALLQRMVSSIASLARRREALRGLRVLRYEVETGYVEQSPPRARTWSGPNNICC